MPELPDVEGFRRFMARHAEGQRIVRVRVPDCQIVHNRSLYAFGRALRGARFASPSRHGKWLMAPLANDDGGSELLLHFGMTGLLTWSEDDTDRHPHDRVIFVCEGGELRYDNMRRFGGVWLAKNAGQRDRVTGPLGPDAARITPREFERLIAARRGGVKAALMDQRLIAGIGNLLSDEILWRSCIDPRTPVAQLSASRRRHLYQALRAAASESIRYGRVPHGSAG